MPGEYLFTCKCGRPFTSVDLVQASKSNDMVRDFLVGKRKVAGTYCPNCLMDFAFCKYSVKSLRGRYFVFQIGECKHQIEMTRKERNNEAVKHE